MSADPSVASGAAPVAKPADAGAPPAVAAALERPEGLPENFFDPATGVKWKELLTEREELTALKAADEARRAGVPEAADKYELKVPEAFKLPDGVELNDKDPRLAGLRAFAHKEGITQAQFEGIIALDAQRVIAGQDEFKAAVANECNKLGANAGPRVDAVVQFINGTAKSPEQAKAVAGMLITAETVEFFERVIGDRTKQGVTTFQRGSGSPPPDPTKIEGFEKMSMVQRLAAIDAQNAQKAR